MVNRLDNFKLNGKALISIYSKNKLIKEESICNIILEQGKKNLLSSLLSGKRTKITKMAIGDGAFNISENSIKIPTKNMTDLHHEVFRKNIESSEIINDQVVFTTNFSAIEVPKNSFLNLNDPFINEIGLIISTNDLSEESVFSLLTFSSIPFKITDEISIAIRYTISIG